MSPSRRACVVALVVAGLLPLAACGSDSATPAGPGTGTTESTGGATVRSDFGGPVSLTALSGQPVSVTLLSLADPAEPENPSLQPEEGKRFVAAEFRLENTGSEPYDDTPSNGVAVIGTTDAEWSANLFDPVQPGFGSLTVAPGESRTAWITFEVPADANLKAVRFATDSGFGSDTEWSLR